MSSPSHVAVHEAGHVLAAHVFDIRVTSASVKPKATHLGIAHFDASGEEPSLDCAIVFVAGSMAVRMLVGAQERTNWLNAVDPDVASALSFLEETPDPLRSRRIVDLRTRALLFTRWPAVLALAAELDRRTILVGAQIEELLRGTRRAGDKPHRPVDPSTRFAVVRGTPVLDKKGHPVSLRRWAQALDGVGFDPKRALALVAKEKAR